MDTRLTVQTDKLVTVANEVHDMAMEYEQQYNNMYTAIESMSSTKMWQGEDNLAYVNRIKEYRNDFVYMKQLMDRYGDFLNKAANVYRAAREATKQRSSKLSDGGK